jgi:hypothetical protein
MNPVIERSLDHKRSLKGFKVSRILENYLRPQKRGSADLHWIRLASTKDNMFQVDRAEAITAGIFE